MVKPTVCTTILIVKRQSLQSCIPGNLFFFRHMEVMMMVSKLTIAFCCSVVGLKLTCKYRLNFDNDKYLFKNVLN